MTRHCPHCDEEFVNSSTLKRHNIAMHTEVRPQHRCTTCSTIYARKDALRRHTRTKHTQEQTGMIRCQFCQGNSRKDYFTRHEPTCARKYWVKVCRIAELTKEIRPDRSNETNLHPPVRWNILPDAEPDSAADKGLRVVREIDIDTRLATKAFNHVFRHSMDTEDVTSCLEAIATSFRHNIPIKLGQSLLLQDDPWENLFWLAISVGEYARGEADINHPSVDGFTMMDRACILGAASLIEPFFWRGAVVFGNRSLFYAIQSGSFDTVRFCLALGADPNDYSLNWNRGDNPLTLASSKSGTSHIASLLVEYGAVMSVANGYGETPLHLAAWLADVDRLRVLLAKDSSAGFLAAINEDGKSALHIAIENIDPDIPEDQTIEFVSALLDAGAEVLGLDYLYSAVRVAVLSDCGAILRLVLSREPNSPRKTEYLTEVLAEAVGGEAMDAFEVLIEAGASVDIGILQRALKYGSLEKVELLLNAGARGDSLEHDTLELLFGAARDQEKPGAKGSQHFTWADAMGKCKLLCWYFRDDRRLRRFMSALEFEVEKFR
jgi:ankyrin repeat protein